MGFLMLRVMITNGTAILKSINAAASLPTHAFRPGSRFPVIAGRGRPTTGRAFRSRQGLSLLFLILGLLVTFSLLPESLSAQSPDPNRPAVSAPAVLSDPGGRLLNASGLSAPAPAVAPATVYYLSPGGADGNSGLAASQPWRTFQHAVPRLLPGDTLILLNGVYTPQSTGLPDINCNDPNKAVSGTSIAPITVRALNERRALLKSDGVDAALYMNQCSYWSIDGLVATSADRAAVDGGRLRSVFQIQYSDHIRLTRLLAGFNNRYFNDHPFSIAYSSHVLVEDAEAYYFHRHGFNIYQSNHVTVRRGYAHSRGYRDIAGGYPSINPDGGDESFVLYNTSNSVIENSISHGPNNAFEIHGGPNVNNLPGGQNNRLLGNIFIEGNYGARIDSREVDDVVWPTMNNVIKDFLVIDSVDNGIILSSGAAETIENVTVFNAGGTGVQSKQTNPSEPFCPDFPSGCTFTMTNSLIVNSGQYGVRVRNEPEWTIEYSNVFNSTYDNFEATEDISGEDIGDGIGRIQNSMSTAPTGIGLSGNQTIVYIPPGSNMKGAGRNGGDIGANILYRYYYGRLTRVPLWNPLTGAFPCRAIVPGLNDVPGQSCFDIHQRLNVTPQSLPLGYGMSTLWLPALGSQ